MTQYVLAYHLFKCRKLGINKGKSNKGHSVTKQCYATHCVNHLPRLRGTASSPEPSASRTGRCDRRWVIIKIQIIIHWGKV